MSNPDVFRFMAFVFAILAGPSLVLIAAAALGESIIERVRR